MELLVGHAVETAELVRQDFQDDMINAQATEEDYHNLNENTLRDFFTQLEIIGGAKCTADAKVTFMLEDATET